MNLVQFKELKILDWRGLHRYDDFESIRDCIHVHGHQITTFALDLISWDTAEDVWADGNSPHTRIPDNFFAQRVLDVQPGDERILLGSLEHLHLSAVSFRHQGMEMANAFNVENLKSLQLRNCPGSLEWLQLILDSGKTMRLKSFEFALDRSSLGRFAFAHITETVGKFVEYLCKLECLFLMLPQPVDWTTLTEKLLNKHNLECLVMHHLGGRGGNEFIDGDMRWPHPLEQILPRGSLTYFGTSMSPEQLVSNLP